MTFVQVLKRLIAVPVLAVAIAACGATPPQPPLKETQKLSVATGAISTACGLAYQVTAFPGPHKKDLETLEATASSSAKKLASVYARNQDWIYDSETVHDIVRDALSMLDTCGLTKAQTVLAHATYARPRHR
jgi:hypothetical protein